MFSCSVHFIKHNMAGNINTTKRIKTFVPLMNINIPNEYTLSVKSKLKGVISMNVRKTSAIKSFEDSIIKTGAKEFFIWRYGGQEWATC